MDDSTPVLRASCLMAGFEPPWWIAGGWAIDLFLGRVSPEHHDLEIALLRRDQDRLRRHLRGWSFRWVVPEPGGGSHDWRREECLVSPVHEVHGERRAEPDGGLRAIEVLLNEATNGVWRYRPDAHARTVVTRPLEEVGLRTPSGVPFLRPEIALLYKAEALRAVDERDFANARPHLTDEGRAWLRDALVTVHGTHPWLGALSDEAST